MTQATATTVDVNTAFAAERAQQIAGIQQWNDTRESRHEQAIASAEDRYQKDKALFDARVAKGELRDLGNGRYEATAGWDRGEIWTLKKVDVGGISQELVLPEHGLDTTGGMAALYSAVPAWHGLGTVIPGGISDIDTVLKLAGLDWTVELIPVTYPWKGETKVNPGRWNALRNDTGDALGIVGDGVAGGGLIQNRRAFEFLQELTQTDVMPWESAGALRGGRRTFVSMRLPENITVDPEGINDKIIPFVVAINNHDGQGTFMVIVTPWRPLCANTERFAVRDAQTSWKVRHTSGALNQLNEARRTLALSNAYYAQYAEEENQLARADFEIDAFRALVDDLWPMDEDADRTEKGQKALETRRANRQEELAKVWTENADKLGKTAYAAERAVTQYLDHHQMVKVGKTLRDQIGSVKDARTTYAMEGVNDVRKAKAHRQLLLRTTR